MARDNDGVVDVCTHLNGVDDQVAEEVQRGVLQVRHREVDPDTALNDDDQQHGQTRGLECEQQDQDNEQRGQHTDQQVILAEGAGQVHGARRIADNVERIGGVVFADDVVHLVDEGERLVGLLGQVQIDDHTAVIVALQLLLGFIELVEQVVQRVLHIARERDVAVVHLLFQEPEHVVDRHFIIVQAVDNLAVLVMVDGVGTVQCLGNLEVEVGHLGQLARGHSVGQHIAVHRFNVGQTHRGFDLGAGVQLVEDPALGLIVARRHNDGHHVAGTEGVFDFLVGDLALALLGGDQVGVGVAVGAQVGKDRRRHDDDAEDRRDDKAGLDVELADGGDLGNQVFVAGLVDQLAEQHQQAGHQRKDTEHTEQDSLDQDRSQVAANAEVHERQRGQAADRRERGGRNLRDSLGKRGNAGLAGGQRLMLIAETVAQNDGVVDGQRQLQYDGD